MIKIHETDINSYDDRGEKLIIYALENEEEFWEIDEMTHTEKCELIGVVDESDYPYAIVEGAFYRSYDFDLSCQHLVVHEHHAINW